MLGWEFPPHHTGGLGEACYQLSRAIATSGGQITFVLPNRMPRYAAPFLDFLFLTESPQGLLVEDSNEFAAVHAYSMSSDTTSSHTELLGGVAAHFSGDLNRRVFRYAELLATRLKAHKQQYDVIHAHDWLTFPAGIVAKEVLKKPLVIHVHNTIFDRSGGLNVDARAYAIEKMAMVAADRIIAVSERTKKTIVDQYGIAPTKIEVVYNSTDFDEHRKDLPTLLSELKATGKRVVLYFGRVTIQKGPDYFLRVAKRVLEYERDVIFVMNGDGDMVEQMLRLATELGITDHVLYVGALWGDERLRLFRAADVYMMPSVSEPFGITALEAIANGTPSIVSRQTGAGEVTGHVLRSDFWDVDDMADKVINLLRSDALRTTMVQNAYQSILDLTWDRAAAKCLSVYTAVQH